MLVTSPAAHTGTPFCSFAGLFRRALHPDWSGSAKVLVLDIEEGQVEVYRYLLHNLHMAGTLKPWLPEGG